MDAEMSSRIRAVLDDPETLSKILSAVSAFSNAGQTAVKTDEPPRSAVEEPQELPLAVSDRASRNALSYGNSEGLFSSGAGGDSRLALLVALKPFLSKERQKKLDSVTKAFTVASVIKNAKNL